jgi:glycine/serine hydroxymethyltransferase
MHIIAAKAVAFGEALHEFYALQLQKKMLKQWQKRSLKEVTISFQEVQTTT